MLGTMIQNINNYTYTPQIKSNYRFNIKTSTVQKLNLNANNNLAPLFKDTLVFTGMSSPSQYKSVFDYLAADILNKNSKKFNIDGSKISAKYISEAIEELFSKDKIFGTYTLSLPEKVKWKSYIPQDIRTYSTDKVNEARFARLNEWKDFLQNPETLTKSHPVLTSEIKQNKSLRFVIWQAINSEIKSNNRHIPVPFDSQALHKTIVGFEKIDPIDRAVRCSSPSFIELYTHRLRDILLVNKGLSDNRAVWVKVPSIKSDPANRAENIRTLEILSCKNWCTRSSVDKAEAALQDGDFYIYLERDKNNLWQPLIGMASCKGKIDQIQGIKNNNIIPVNELKNIKEFIKANGLKCNSQIIPEGPKALQQIYITEKLAQVNELTEKTLEKAIKENDDYSILTSLIKDVKQLQNGNFEIPSYKPSYNANKNSGISIPYSMMGINEDIMLQNVERIDGNFVLTNKNPLFSSTITKFPPNLKTVSGKIICSQEQFNMFKEDILRVTDKNTKQIIIHST